MARYPIIARLAPGIILDAELVSQISREEYEVTDIRWRAYKQLHRSARQETASIPENHDRKWADKASHTTAEDHRFLALKFAGEIEGMAMLSLRPLISRRPGNSHELLLYVEYLETAPWNQRAYAGDTGRFMGVGASLITAATEVSFEQGCEGRLALHSLAQANGFYTAMGFTDLGLDPVEGLNYFELGTTRVYNDD